jgi:hypothetical protein
LYPIKDYPDAAPEPVPVPKLKAIKEREHTCSELVLYRSLDKHLCFDGSMRCH